jgi:hypothetical protein
VVHRRLALAALSVLASLVMASCATDEHHSNLGQSPPGRGDYNTACNPASRDHIGVHLPRSERCQVPGKVPTGEGK